MPHLLILPQTKWHRYECNCSMQLGLRSPSALICAICGKKLFRSSLACSAYFAVKISQSPFAIRAPGRREKDLLWAKAPRGPTERGRRSQLRVLSRLNTPSLPISPFPHLRLSAFICGKKLLRSSFACSAYFAARPVRWRLLSLGGYNIPVPFRDSSAREA